MGTALAAPAPVPCPRHFDHSDYLYDSTFDGPICKKKTLIDYEHPSFVSKISKYL